MTRLGNWTTRLPLALTASALPLLAFANVANQWQFLPLLLVSLWSMAWIGHATLTALKVDAQLVEESVFLRVCTGQFALLVAWLVLSPVTYLWHGVLGLPLTTTLLVALVVACAGIAVDGAGVSFRKSIGAGTVFGAAFVALAFAVIYKAGAYFSHRAGALGLDTHQHIAFAIDLYHAGYPKLTAGDSDWLEKYPKLLHVLSSLWAWPGFGAQIASYVKVQPVLQALIAIFAMMELLVFWQRRSAVPERAIGVTWAIIAVFGAYVMLRGTTVIYPVDDLNSTGRLSAFCVMMLAPLAATLLWLAPGRRLAVAAWASLPFAAAMSAKLNPSLVFAFTSFSAVAFLTIIALPTVRALPSAGGISDPVKGLLVGVLLAAVLLLLDPYYLHLLGEVSPRWKATIELVSGTRFAQGVSDVGVVAAGNFAERLAEVLRWELFHAAHPKLIEQMLPSSEQILSEKMLTITRLFVPCSLAFFVLAAAARRKIEGAGRWFVLMPIVIQCGLLVGELVAGRVSYIVILLFGHDTLQASLLSTYTSRYVGLLAMYALPLHWTLATVMSLTAIWWLVGGSRRLLPAPSAASLRAVAGTFVVLMILVVSSLSVRGPAASRLGWVGPLDADQLDEFNRLEGALPEHAVVLAPAYAIRINGREDWVLPAQPVAAYLPFARRDYVFNVRIGKSYTLTAKDLNDAFCTNKAKHARSFLRSHDVEYMMVVQEPWESEGGIFDRKLCTISYRDLGIQLPAVASGQYGLHFYRLMP